MSDMRAPLGAAASGARDGTGPAHRGRTVAVLGPTNTGKTYLAMERMLAHRTGMIGFPLRLLARENYDKVVKAKGPNAVALVTGEEKIIPPYAQYWICTVESMPLDRQVQFLAVDEIQLAADPERGHIFTDRLLKARGTEETMFLGSDTARDLIRKLVPGVEYISRPRFSQLSFAGHKKLSRLPPRSAIVAFSTTEVYALAEMVRRSRGGTAVVLGALSPRTRNAQVAMYQAGDVDYLVATDAIGMGLNMDVDHVWFARLNKFDGVQPRRLKETEVAQIAGRAGRHLTDGTFGTTWDCAPLDEETVLAVENHEFPSLKSLMWRNSDLDFRTLPGLLRSLEERPFSPVLIRARDADDQLALQTLAKEEDIAAQAKHPEAVRLLWEVCQIPDFRKVMSDQHTRLLGQIYRHLRGSGRRLPEDWVTGQVARLDRVEGDIDALVARIAHVRTWTYVSHRADWLADPKQWQERTRAIEDKLSDALHERLTQRFVDKRSAGLVKSLRDGRDLIGSVAKTGEVMVEGHGVGRLEGLRFTLDAEVAPEDQRALMTAARRALKDEIAARIARIEAAGDEEFTLSDEGDLSWEGAPLGRLAAGPSVLQPVIKPLNDDLLDSGQRERVRARLAVWMQARIARDLAPLLSLELAELSGPARGIAFQVAEHLGALPRAAIDGLINDLNKDQRRALFQLGVRLGFSYVFLPTLTKPKAVALRALLWAVRHGQPLPAPVPPPGRVSVPSADIPRSLFAAVGYPAVGPRAIRVDMLDRLEKELAHRAKGGRIADISDLPALLGCSNEDLAGVLNAMGWQPKQIPASELTPPAAAPAVPAAEPAETSAEAAAETEADTPAQPEGEPQEQPPAEAVPQDDPPAEVAADAVPAAAPEDAAALAAADTAPAAPEDAAAPAEPVMVTVWVRRPRRHSRPASNAPGDRSKGPRRKPRGPKREGEAAAPAAAGQPTADAPPAEAARPGRGPAPERGPGPKRGPKPPRPERKPEREIDPDHPFAVLRHLTGRR